MNKVRIYTDEELKILMNNPNVVQVRNKSQIIYKNDFKLWAVQEKLSHEEKTAKEIFAEGKFDVNMLDDRTPQKRLNEWVKKYKKFGEDYFSDDKTFYQARKESGKVNRANQQTGSWIILVSIENAKTNN